MFGNSLARCGWLCYLGVSNGLIQCKSARKIWPMLELFAKIRSVLACLCSQNFCYRSHARILVKISVWQNEHLGENCTRYECFWKHASSFCHRFIAPGARNNSSRKAPAKVASNLETWRHAEYYYCSSTLRGCQSCMASIGYLPCHNTWKSGNFTLLSAMCSQCRITKLWIDLRSGEGLTLETSAFESLNGG